MRLYVILHPCRAAGGLSVGINFVNALTTFPLNDLKLGLCIPSGLGYEQLAKKLSDKILCFNSSSNVVERIFFDHVTLPRVMRSFKPDAELVFGNIGIPSLSNTKRIHLLDDPHYVYPYCHWGPIKLRQKLRYAFQKPKFIKSLKKSSLIFTQTGTMEKRFVKKIPFSGSFARMPNSLSNVIIERAGSTLTSLPKSEKTLKCLCLTRYYAHKNLELIVETFKKKKEMLHDVTVDLTVSRKQSSGARRLIKDIQKNELCETIKCIGTVQQKNLSSLFAKYNCFLFPTLMESFSASYLEAMFFGLPIITSDLDFAHEMCGKAASYVNPWSIDSLGNALVYFRDNPEERIQLVKEGKKQLEKMHNATWQEIVEESINTIRNII